MSVESGFSRHSDRARVSARWFIFSFTVIWDGRSCSSGWSFVTEKERVTEVMRDSVCRSWWRRSEFGVFIGKWVMLEVQVDMLDIAEEQLEEIWKGPLGTNLCAIE